MRAPEYHMQRSDDFGRVGPLGASILALVRYVTAVPDDKDGRREIDGQTWWRATAPEITEALGGGISPRTVSWTVKQLTESGELRAIPTHDFHGDRAKAYRVSDLTSARSDTGSDLRSARSDTAVCKIRHSPSARSDTPPVSDFADVPIPEELEEEKQEGGAREPDPLDVEVVPDTANPHPPQTVPEIHLDKSSGAPVFDAEVVDEDPDPEPPRFCDRHPNDTPDPCGPCIGRRRAHDRWMLRHPVPPPKSKLRAWWELTEKLRAEEERAEDARAAEPEPEPPAVEAKAGPKPRPTPPPWVPGPDGLPRCRRHAHLPHPHPSCTACRDLREAS